MKLNPTDCVIITTAMWKLLGLRNDRPGEIIEETTPDHLINTDLHPNYRSYAILVDHGTSYRTLHKFLGYQLIKVTTLYGDTQKRARAKHSKIPTVNSTAALAFNKEAEGK